MSEESPRNHVVDGVAHLRERSPYKPNHRSRSPIQRANQQDKSHLYEKSSGKSTNPKSRSPYVSPRRNYGNRNSSRSPSLSQGRSPNRCASQQQKYSVSRSPRNSKWSSNSSTDKNYGRDFQKESFDSYVPDKRDSRIHPERAARKIRTGDQSPKFDIPIRQPIPASRVNNAQEPSSVQQEAEEEVEKEKPNFGLSGLLTAETNTFNGVVVKYNEPPEALKPTSRWRWYAFKGEEQIDILQLHRQSAYLIGKDRKVADIPLDHASISKQHAVLQYRKVVENNPITGQPRPVVKPYIIDLESSNGTFVNGAKIPPSRYFELKSADVIKFAFSTREYVFLQEE
ncbi:hypothetical protein DSO57_1030282 [Entomophthora muscae]|uniref:Uncharacterized protein n=1 Tax=Entomophthora muscae TaxID=34485 RepID=A0ACC2SDM1_9FUNG|nr:hypothetical protein DSO57_1030282 [Entomophthora muscae]